MKISTIGLIIILQSCVQGRPRQKRGLTHNYSPQNHLAFYLDFYAKQTNLIILGLPWHKWLLPRLVSTAPSTAKLSILHSQNT